MTYTYHPKGVCSREMDIEVDENGIITRFDVLGGCNGNLKGLSALVLNRKADEVAGLLRGITCGDRGTSCPDQFARALSKALK